MARNTYLQGTTRDAYVLAFSFLRGLCMNFILVAASWLNVKLWSNHAAFADSRFCNLDLASTCRRCIDRTLERLTSVSLPSELVVFGEVFQAIVVDSLARLKSIMTKRDRQDTPDWQQEVPYKPYAQNDKDFEIKYKSSCLCGKVQYAVNSDPCAAKFCHCTGCQRLHGAPFQWAAVYHKKNVRFLKGVDHIGFLNTQDREPKRELPAKVSCITCHSPIASEGRNMWMAFPTLFDFEDRKIPASFQPDCHIFYSERCMDVNDGMPKWSGHKEDSDRMEEVKSKHNVS